MHITLMNDKMKRKYRIYSNERLCLKERLPINVFNERFPLMTVPIFSQKGRSFEK